MVKAHKTEWIYLTSSLTEFESFHLYYDRMNLVNSFGAGNMYKKTGCVFTFFSCFTVNFVVCLNNDY